MKPLRTTGTATCVWGMSTPRAAENCYLHASNRMVAALGVSDLVVVETADSVLVADRARTQDVKKIVESLKKEGRGEAENHPLVYRPWGS